MRTRRAVTAPSPPSGSERQLSFEIVRFPRQNGFLMSRYWSLTFIVLTGCGGGAPRPSAESPRTIVLDEISLSPCPERESGATPIEVVPVAEPARPEAVGVWSRSCDPENPGPHVPRGHDVLIYDGAFITLASNVEPIARPEPPISMFVTHGVFRLESRWDGDLLEVRFPPWLLRDALEDEWLPIARLRGDHFVWPENGEVAYERAQPRRNSPALAEPREPLDYERVTADRARGALIFHSVEAELHRCAEAGVERLARPYDTVRIGFSVRLDETGAIIGAPTVESEDAELVACVTASLVGLRVAGFEAPQEAGYSLTLRVAARQ